MLNFKLRALPAVYVLTMSLLTASHALADNDDISAEPAVPATKHRNLTAGLGAETATLKTGDQKTISTIPMARVNGRYLSLGDGFIGSMNIDGKLYYHPDSFPSDAFKPTMGYAISADVGGGVSTAPRGVGFVFIPHIGGSVSQLPHQYLKGGGLLGLEIGPSISSGRNTAILTAYGAGTIDHDQVLLGGAKFGGRFRMMHNSRYYMNLDIFKRFQWAIANPSDVVAQTQKEQEAYQGFAKRGEDSIRAGDAPAAEKVLKDANDYKVSLDPNRFLKPIDGETARATFGVGIIPHVAIEGYAQVDNGGRAFRKDDGTMGETSAFGTQFGLTFTAGVH